MAPSRPSSRQRPPSLWKLGGLTLWQLSKNVAHETVEADLPGAASELAFNFLLALFPLILFMLALFSLFAAHRSQLQYSLMSYFRDLLPPAAFELLNKITDQMAANSNSRRFTFGIVIALWFASGGISSMISTLNVVYHVHETRSWGRVRAVALLSTLAISVLVLSALFLVLVSGDVVDWIGRALHLQSIVVLFWKGVQWPAALVFVMLSCSLIYYYAPDLESPRWYWITPGSAFGAVLWLLASIGFRAYLHFFNTYSTYYGPLGAMMMLLVWLYATGLAFLIGGEINAQIGRASLPAEPGRRETDAQV
jgi:membrane protein